MQLTKYEVITLEYVLRVFVLRQIGGGLKLEVSKIQSKLQKEIQKIKGDE